MNTAVETIYLGESEIQIRWLKDKPYLTVTDTHGMLSCTGADTPMEDQLATISRWADLSSTERVSLGMLVEELTRITLINVITGKNTYRLWYSPRYAKYLCRLTWENRPQTPVQCSTAGEAFELLNAWASLQQEVFRFDPINYIPIKL